jgi:hypothetical protein
MIELIIDRNGEQASAGYFFPNDLNILMEDVRRNGIGSECLRFNYAYRGHELCFSANEEGMLVCLLHVASPDWEARSK